MFRAFMFGVLATIVTALGGGYFVLRNGTIPANASGRVGSRFGAAIEGQSASWEEQPLHPRMPSETGRVRYRRPLCRPPSPQAQRSRS